ncbi:uncharacterized protein [Leptinotarsa decemlineata]|uniref:uncharacterized protein n=1 Tax=Leptinotarsa decemlineata TaxID=7539 RepID=UPI003D30A6AA
MAVERMVSRIKENKRGRRHRLVVALDLSNAFNTAWAPAIEVCMRRMGMPENVGRTCMSFEGERIVTCGAVSEMVNRGCQQGSSLGPTLWLLVMEAWFEIINRMKIREGIGATGVQVQAYADDQLVIIEGNSVDSIENGWKLLWVECKVWEEEMWLNYNEMKTECMFIPTGRDVRIPVLRMHGREIEQKTSVRYLGIAVDTGLLFIDHHKEVRRKLSELTGKLRKWTGKNVGLKRECVRMIYERVAKPAAKPVQVWGERAHDSRVKRQLSAAQRPFLLASCGAYRTTPTAALSVIIGMAPLQIEGWARYHEWRANGRRKIEERVKGEDKIPPWLKGELLEGEEVTEVYVDAGAMMEEERMGIGWAYKRRGDEWTTGNEKITRQSSVKGAESVAIERVIGMWSMEENLRVVSDSAMSVERVNARRVGKRIARIQRMIEERRERGVRTQIMWRRGHDTGKMGNLKAHEEAHMGMNKEQVTLHVMQSYSKLEERKRVKENIKREWERGTTGRLFHRFCRTVGNESLDLSRKAIQLLTGHGNFPGYLARFRLGPEVPCPCGYGEPEAAEHVIDRCLIGDRIGWREWKERMERMNGQMSLRD